MPSYDHPSAAGIGSTTHTPGAFAKGLAGSSSLRNYRVTEQIVNLDVDLENRSIVGSTTIIVTPTEPVLKFVKLDCRQLTIESVLVNGKRAQYLYEDPLREEYDALLGERKSVFNDVHQYHFYKGQHEKMFRGEHTEELTIIMPDNLKLYPQDPSTISGMTPHGGQTHTPGSHKATNLEMFYTNVKIRIEYSLKNPTTGLHFVGGKGSSLSKNEWYAYTSNTSYGVSTSSWVPCVDSLVDKCSWTLDIGVPKTVKQIGVSKLIGALDSNTLNATEDDEDEDESTEISVVFGDFAGQKENAHPVDLAKKSVSIDLYNATSAHHIGFVVGPFVQVPLINFQDDDAAREKDTSSVPIAVYCFPHQTSDALNTTIFMHKALDFFSKEFGSYPNASCALVFINDLDIDYNGFCGFTLLNDRLLYSINEIDPLFDSTYKLLVSLAEQWSGIYVVPSTYNDIWITVGIAHYMALQFIKDLMGLNEYKYRIKRQAERICEEDVGKDPLSKPNFAFPVAHKDLDFIKLKAPIVLFILDKRMTKQSFGLSRVFPKIFLQCMSGDLPNGSLSTHHFQHVCEKVNHNRLETFFRQWVHGSGVPVFMVSQRFNKKRMFIEMGIRQVQGQDPLEKQPTKDNFIPNAVHKINVESESGTKIKSHQLFTGPMTIRIHEADGTPYEHIVDLKEGFTKLDIQYNTKYKRLKRSQKQIKSEKEAKEAAEEDDQILLHCLGDILQTPNDISDWKLTDWSKEEEMKMTNEAFEWIRIDADFEWICKIHLTQPDYMYASQLQQDRDVEAQLESIHYFENSQPSALYSSILLRTLMDDRYYYGIRVSAALAMAKLAKKETNWISKEHLLLAFKRFFCFQNSEMPMPNDFSDFPTYFIKNAIPLALSLIRDENQRCPLDVKRFLLSILKYNQNLGNNYSDTHYVGHLLECLTSAIIANTPSLNELNDDEKRFLNHAIGEISRQQKMDEWTEKSSVSVVALRQKLRLRASGLLEITPEYMIERTCNTNSPDIRIAAFEGLFQMGALKNSGIMKYFFMTLLFERSGYLKNGLALALSRGLAASVIEGCSAELDEDELSRPIDVTEDSSANNGIIIEEGNSHAFESRRDAASRTSLKGAIDLLRRQYSEYIPLQREMWNTVRNPLLSIGLKRDLFDMIAVVIPSLDTLAVTLPMPREKRLVAENQGRGVVLFKREGYFKISLPIIAKPSTAKPPTQKAPVIQRRKSVSKPILKNKSTTVRAKIRRHGPAKLRYVKIIYRKGQSHILVSSSPIKSKKVSLKIQSDKLKAISEGSLRLDLTVPPKSKSQPVETSTIPSINPVTTSPAKLKPKLKLKFKF